MKHGITLSTAVTMTQRYRQNRDGILDATYQNLDLLSFNETFDRIAVDTLLTRNGCAALRIYYGMDEDLNVHAVLVGVDSNNKDILPPQTLQDGEEEPDDYIADLALRCPSSCPPESPLNEP